ncbi:alpha/beta fold hydrolase [Micromonospora sp. NPDC092111]|uniref:alpha/beta fold hydrolase n=1 Tax=Micromonospora sp. NPDC092111 TaxID=3364289 RepID=UPI0037F311F3
MVNPIVAMVRRPHERRLAAARLAANSPDGVYEEGFREVGGIDQWVTVRGDDRDAPVVLMVHGGPGSPYTPFNPTLGAWERALVVVQWDQRGGGHTWIRAHERDTAPLTLDRLAEDGIDLAQQLVVQFRRRILLVGSSVGSLTGAIMAKRRPDLFTAYVAANVYAADSPRESHRLTREAAGLRGDRRTLSRLDRIGPDPARWSPHDAEAVSKAAIRVGQGVPDMVYDLMLPALMYDPTLTMADIRAVDRGIRHSLRALQPEYGRFDFDALGWDFAVPYVAIHGEGDLVSPLGSARRHAGLVRSPWTRFVTVPTVGHLVEFAARDRFLAELLAVVAFVEHGTPGVPGANA